MPNQDINLTSFDPDMLKVQRARKLAEMLQQQSQQDIPINSYNGIQAPISPFSSLAKILGTYVGYKANEKADSDYKDLQTKRRTDLADMLSKQYQVPGQTAQGVNAPNMPAVTPDTASVPMPQISPEGAISSTPAAPPQMGAQSYDPTQGAISNPTAARPTTPQEQLANSLSMMTSSNPMAAQMGQPLYEQALQKQQASQLLSSLDLSSVPERERPIISAQIKQGDVAGALKTYGDATKPQVVGGALVAPQAGGGYKTLVEPTDGSIKEYQFAQQQGFKGSLADWQKTKAQNTHITVDAGAHGWQVVNDPGTGLPYRYNPNTGQSTKLDGSPLAAGPTGYAKVATPNMRNPVAIYMDAWSKENPKASAADKLSAMNAFAGQQATARTLGNIDAKIGSAANGLDIMADQSTTAYNKLGRGNFVPFNKLQQMASTNAFSTPEQADAYAADAGVINLWGKSINPSGVLTVEAQKRGEQMLSQAQSPEAHAAVIERMKAEGRASRSGVSQSQAGIGGVRPAAAAPVTGKPTVSNW